MIRAAHVLQVGYALVALITMAAALRLFLEKRPVFS
jgi:hypothetical protein